jgi:predicted dienelactone hydrolase
MTLAALALLAALGGDLRVGYRVLDLREGERTVATALWYPTEAEPREFLYGGGPNRGKVAPDAAPRQGHGPCPLLVFSHGYGGGGTGSVFLCEALAARGWIVAAPDHEDRDKAVRIRTGAQKIDGVAYLRRARALAASGRDFDRKAHAYRLDDLALVLDRLMESDEFNALVDWNRVAAGGHSLGGFTALGIAGAIEGRRDERVKAVLLFSPGVFMYSKEEFAAVKVPTMFFLGERELGEERQGTTKSDLAAAAFGAFPAPKYYLEVRGASHFSFNNRSSEAAAAGLLSGTEDQFDVIRKYAIAFLEKHVAWRDDGGVLERDDPRLSRYRRE